jgi:hypothetical protein
LDKKSDGQGVVFSQSGSGNVGMVGNGTQNVTSAKGGGFSGRALAGGLLCLVAAGLAVAAFYVGSLTHDQRQIMRAVFALATGLAMGLIGGTLSPRVSGKIGTLSVAATGGGAGWVLAALYLFPSP